MKSRSWSGIAVSIAFGCFMLVSCGRSGGLNPLDFVPSNAIAVVRIDARQVASDRTYGFTIADTRSAAAMRELGLDATSADTIVIYSDSTTGSPEATILKGDRFGTRWKTAARSDRWTSSSGLVSASIGRDIVVVGTADQVNAILAARSRTQRFTSLQEFAAFAPIFAAGRPVEITVIWPPAVRDATQFLTAATAGTLKLGGIDAIGQIVGKIGIGRALAMTVWHTGDVMQLDFGAMLSDESSATLLIGGLSLAKGLGKLAPPESSPSARMWSSMAIGRQRDVVRVGLSVPLSYWAAR